MLYEIIKPITDPVPIILSIPHSGLNFPEEIKNEFKEKQLAFPEDTDWLVHRLYDFAASMGITTIKANYSRYVIDLNRDPQNKALYNDGRFITELVPKHTFLGQSLYNSSFPDKDEVARRHKEYFLPYHQKIQALISDKKQSFSNVLLFDAHSIKKHVPSINKKPFPDLILGNNDGKTSGSKFTESVHNVLRSSGLEVSQNAPFKGGYITRSFGDPKNGVHAIQLEMAQSIYMNQDEKTLPELWNPEKAQRISELLKLCFKKLIEDLSNGSAL